MHYNEPALLSISPADDFEFTHIDSFDKSVTRSAPKDTAGSENSAFLEAFRLQDMHQEENTHEPRHLENGKWTCKHKCKNKQTYVFRKTRLSWVLIPL